MKNPKKETIATLIKNSNLSDKDKESFITFLNSISENNLFQIIQIFEKKPEEVEQFWITLKPRIAFLHKIELSDNLLKDKKAKIMNQITKMNDDEFNACVNGTKGIKNETDLKEKIEKFSKDRKESHEEFMTSAKEFLRKITHYQSEIQQKKDERKADEIIQKIKSLKS